MERVTANDKVLIRFTGRLLDGRVVDSSERNGAIELQLGNGSVIPGLEREIIGMRAGETKSALLRADDAFGRRRQDLILHIDPRQLPDNVSLHIGEVLTMQNDAGDKLRARVTEVSDREVVLDANHPLAGHDVTFDIEVVRILGDPLN